MPLRKVQHRNTRRGIELLEVMIAVGILTFSFATISSAIVAGQSQSLEARKTIIQNDLKDHFSDNENILIKKVSGLLTDFAKSNEATCIIRGLRAVSDFEYEFQMTGMNYQLNPQIETIFLMSSDQKSFISSKLVKEVHKLGGDVSNFVTNNTVKVLDEKNTRS